MAKSKLKWGYITIFVLFFFGIVLYLNRQKVIEGLSGGSGGSKGSKGSKGSNIGTVPPGGSCKMSIDCANSSNICKNGICK
jgi:hypothetical protein